LCVERRRGQGRAAQRALRLALCPCLPRSRCTVGEPWRVVQAGRLQARSGRGAGSWRPGVLREEVPPEVAFGSPFWVDFRCVHVLKRAGVARLLGLLFGRGGGSFRRRSVAQRRIRWGCGVCVSGWNEARFKVPGGISYLDSRACLRLYTAMFCSLFYLMLRGGLADVFGSPPAAHRCSAASFVPGCSASSGERVLVCLCSCGAAVCPSVGVSAAAGSTRQGRP
jgi:hypothetical protein